MKGFLKRSVTAAEKSLQSSSESDRVGMISS